MERNFYSYTSIKSDQIRLVCLCPGGWTDTIFCEMHVVQYRDSTPYEALSYVWGDQENKTMIIVDGCRFAVTLNLESALRHLRLLSGKRWLWIDQLCIDQINDSEKSDQVSLMKYIYKNASHVPIWPGDQDELLMRSDLINALELLSVLSENRHLDEVQCFELSDDSQLQITEKFSAGFEVLCRLMRMPWWTRIWTVQEIVLAPQASFLTGSGCIEWSALENAARNLQEHRNTCCLRLFGRLTPKYYDGLNLFYLPIVDIAIYRHEYRTRADLILTLHRFRNRCASDPRDKIYGLSGLIQERALTAEYLRDFRCVYINFMICVISKEKNLRPLLDTKPEWEQYCDLPSWVIDWRNPVDSNHLRFRTSRYFRYKSFPDLPAARLIHNSLLRLLGIQVDKIELIYRAERFSRGSKVYGALEKIQSLVASKFSSSDLYVTEGTFEEAFWRTLLGGLVWENSRYRSVSPDDYPLYKAFCSAKRPWGHEDAFRAVANTVEMSLNDRAFFITTEGYIGTGPPTARVGDEIFVIRGSNVPFIFRNQNQGVMYNVFHDFQITAPLYSFVGDSYVHGLMNGEVENQTGKHIKPLLLC